MDLTTKQKYEALRRAKLAARKRLNFYASQEDQLDRQAQRLQAAIIREDKLLGKHPWTVTMRGNEVTLSSTVDWNKLPELVELLKPDYHCQYDLGWEQCTRTFRGEEVDSEQTSVTLHFSDGDVYLYCTSVPAAIKFVQDFGVMLDFTNMEKQVAKLAEQHAGAVELLQNAKLLSPES